MGVLMPSAKLLIGGAAATAAVGVRVARGLYGRWRLLPGPDRERIAGYAEDAKEKALAVRGSAEQERAAAEEDLRSANATLAAALVETAEADPEVEAEEVAALREELRRELERLADAEISAARIAEVKPSRTGQGHG
jgi:predicted negative regulator of RcsB-dependent stress response